MLDYANNNKPKYANPFTFRRVISDLNLLLSNQKLDPNNRKNQNTPSQKNSTHNNNTKV